MASTLSRFTGWSRAHFVLLGGRVGDLVGRRRLFLAALTVFLAFSGLGGLAQDGWVLVVARFVTGLSAAFMTPVGLSIITTSFAESRTRNQALLYCWRSPCRPRTRLVTT
jgi:MFS family permease